MTTFWLLWMFFAVLYICYYLERISSTLERDRRDRQESDSLEERMAAARFMREAQDRANTRALISAPNALAEQQIKKR